MNMSAEERESHFMRLVLDRPVPPFVMRFMAAFRAFEREAEQRGEEREREVCAQIAEDHYRLEGGWGGPVAQAIRARSEKTSDG